MTIKINLKIFIFIVFFYFTKQINVYYTLMIFAMLHELGHLITGILLGLKPKKITIMPYGISAAFLPDVMVSSYKKTAKKELIVSLARSSGKYIGSFNMRNF